MSIFNVGTGALNAAQVGMLTTSHNVANVSTTGYNRQVIVQGTNHALLTGSGFIGNGAHVATVRRVYDEYLSRQVLRAESGAAEMDSYLAQAEQIDNLLADPDAGMSPALAAFFKGVQDVAANPASIPARQAMLSTAHALVGRLQGLDSRMQDIRDGVNTQLQGQVAAVNNYAVQIAELNGAIILAEAGSVTQQPNDLYDQRDQLVRDLNKVVGVTVVKQTDGAFNLFIGQGQPLVIGTQYYGLAAMAAPDDPQRLIVAMQTGGGTLMPLQESQISGGALGGLVSFRSGTLDAAQNSLGRIGVTLAQNFNDQHHLGMDLTGLLGADFFAAPTIATPQASTLNNGAGAPTVAFDVATMAQLAGSDYRLAFVGGAYQLTRLSDNKLTTLVAPVTVVDGMSIDISAWAPAANDSFLLQPTRTGASGLKVAISDPRAIAAAAPIRTGAALSNIGTGSISAGVVLDTTLAEFANFNATTQIAPPLKIVFDTPANTYSVYDNTTPAAPVLIQGGVAYAAGTPIQFPQSGPPFAYQVTVSGVPSAGDSFTLEGNKNGVADSRNALLLGALQSKPMMMGGATFGPTATYQSAYSQIVGAVGVKTSEVKTVGAAQAGLAEHANRALQQLSGVNLDEEAANLLRYQQAYQAAAKIIEIANKVFDEVIALGR